MIKLICTKDKIKQIFDVSDLTLKEVNDFATKQSAEGFDVRIKRRLA